ncbi:MAG: hypothetical protein ACK5O2_02575 [Microthrixaceae bacterium]
MDRQDTPMAASSVASGGAWTAVKGAVDQMLIGAVGLHSRTELSWTAPFLASAFE